MVKLVLLVLLISGSWIMQIKIGKRKWISISMILVDLIAILIMFRKVLNFQ